MKSRMLMVALTVVMLVGVRTYANDCGPCSEVDPCGACNGCTKSCDLFSGLKRLSLCRPCDASECGPCDAIVACTPCDEANCDPCGACDDGCGKKLAFGSRLKGLFASKGCSPCDPCGPCDNACGACDEAACNPCDADCGPCDSSCSSKFSLRNLFKGFGKIGSCNDGCGPCDADCGPCDNTCGPCDSDCGACDASCGKKFGSLLDRPRQSLKKIFDGFRLAKCSDCGPCDACGPCDTACGGPCDAAPSLPEAAK